MVSTICWFHLKYLCLWQLEASWWVLIISESSYVIRALANLTHREKWRPWDWNLPHGQWFFQPYLGNETLTKIQTPKLNSLTLVKWTLWFTGKFLFSISIRRSQKLYLWDILSHVFIYLHLSVFYLKLIEKTIIIFSDCCQSS